MDVLSKIFLFPLASLRVKFAEISGVYRLPSLTIMTVSLWSRTVVIFNYSLNS